MLKFDSLSKESSCSKINALLKNHLFVAQHEEDISEDEKNLLYVAVSRAKKRLQMSPELLRLLKAAGVCFILWSSSPFQIKNLEWPSGA